MSDRQLDVLLIHPSSRDIYQGLRSKYSAVEPPTTSLMLAQSVRAAGYGVAILDCDADNLTDAQAVEKVKEANPRLACFVVMGSEPNQSTVRMSGAVPLCDLLKKTYPQYKTCFTGGHVSALPLEVLAIPSVDYVLLNEGAYALRSLLGTRVEEPHYCEASGITGDVAGVGWKTYDGHPLLNRPSKIVPQDRMDEDLPGYAWDLVDLNKYRSHTWFGGYVQENRQPYAAIYTSLGCPHRCGFCMINSINRNSNDEGWTAADSAVFRHWTPEHSMRQVYTLATQYGVKNIRISDEMFFLKRSHYEPLLRYVREQFGDSLNLWAYARVDSVKPRDLELFRGAGVRWLCLGVEAADTTVRREVAKGSYEEVDVRQVIRGIEDAGIDVILNMIVGLPGDTYDTMNRTMELSYELNTSMFNLYTAMALPGSPLHAEARRKGWRMPEDYAGYGFLSYTCQPCPTDTLTPAEILRFRDENFPKYWGRPVFQAKIERKFGPAAVENIQNMLRIRLKRKLLGDTQP